MILSQVILTLLAAALATAMLSFVLLWRQLQELRSHLNQLAASLQRSERDIAGQRYALASLQQKNTGTADDEELLERAFTHADADNAKAGTDEAPAAATELSDLKQGQVLQFLKKAIKNNEIQVTLQPIVRLPQRLPAFYEMFARIKVGEQGYISAGKFIAVAKDNDLMSTVDNLLLLRCLQMIKKTAKKDSTVSYFVNISSSTLTNKAYVTDLITFLSANPQLSSHLVFEMTQADTLKMPGNVKQVMEGLALLGCRFSMDQVGFIGLDIDRLSDLNISFVKLDTNLILKEIQDTDKRNRLRKMKTMLDMNGISVIMEKVENDKQLQGLGNLYVTYAQGYLFGRPEEMA